MIVVDANVLIGYIRRPDPAVRRVLASGSAAVCGVTWAEMLHGARTPAEVANISAVLSALPQVPTPETVWVELGTNLAALRCHGIVVPFQDALLATIAIQHRIEVWSLDAHFRLMQPVLPLLRLYVPPQIP